MLQFHRMRVVSDLIILNECSQFAGAAIATVVDVCEGGRACRVGRAEVGVEAGLDVCKCK